MNVRRISANVIVNLKHFFREKSAVFFVLLFPILLILLFGFIFQGQGEVSYDLSVQNLDGGPHADALLRNITWSGIFSVDEVDGTINVDTQYVEDHSINTLLVIPEGYSAGVDSMLDNSTPPAPVPLTIYYDPSNTAAMSKVQILSSIVGFMNKQLANTTDYIFIDQPISTASEDLEYIEFFVPGIIAMSVMSSSLFGTVGINTELRQKGILRKLATTPLTRSEWLLSNILYQFIMALMSTTVILLVGFLVFGLRPHIGPFMFLFIILNVFAFGGIGMLITRFVKEAESAQAAANAVMFPMMFLAGTFFPLEMMPDFLKVIAKVLPLYYVNEGLRASMITMNNNIIIVSATVIFVFSMVVFILGVLLTTWKDD
jgi:ABC-2 type transport system permease protein